MNTPEFDQLTQYVVEENGVLVVKDIARDDEPIVEHMPEPSEPYVPEPTLEERIQALEVMELERILGGGF